MITMQLSELAQKLNADFTGNDCVVTGISTDTRNIVSGNLFIAIIGDRFDGHHFVETAYTKGACAAIVNRLCDSPIPQLVVTDTIEALGKISALWRNQFSIPFVGVTGSNGKTTVKNMIASILKAACNEDDSQILATRGTLNNHIGLPITLAGLTTQHRYGVIEMGMNHEGEIAYLTQLVKPHIAVITNAAESHLDGLKDVAGVARAKGEIFLGLPPNGFAILNKDDAFFEYWYALIKSYRCITFGLQNTADVSATFVSNQLITLQTPIGKIDINLPLLGKHNVMNALAATAATLALHIDLPAIKAGLEAIQPAPGRLNQHFLATGTRIIDDTYNANPFSFEAALHALSIFDGKKIIVLGDMRELGDNARLLHATAGKNAKALGIDHLFTLGELSAATAESFGENACHFTDHTLLVQALLPYLQKDNTILVKGSRSMHMEKIVAQLVSFQELTPTP